MMRWRLRFCAAGVIWPIIAPKLPSICRDDRSVAIRGSVILTGHQNVV